MEETLEQKYEALLKKFVDRGVDLDEAAAVIDRLQGDLVALTSEYKKSLARRKQLKRQVEAFMSEAKSLTDKAAALEAENEKFRAVIEEVAPEVERLQAEVKELRRSKARKEIRKAETVAVELPEPKPSRVRRR